MPKLGKPRNGKSNRSAGRTQAPRPLVALYGLGEGTQRGDAVRSVVRQLNIPVRTIEVNELGLSVGAIAGIMGSAKAGKPYPGVAPNVEFMLISGLPNVQLDQLLSALREKGASVPLKAQVTPHNRFWPVHLLISEIVKEHEAMAQAENGANS